MELNGSIGVAMMKKKNNTIIYIRPSMELLLTLNVVRVPLIIAC